ncbi:MAG: hypothetical protein IID61_05155 [SAR324 cluster bacterium]|nr:hypothetical protein [SAR324 cluster bacterium]
MGEGGKGTFVWIGGTGKFNGIAGGGWYKSTPYPAPGLGKFAGVNEFGLTYKIS